ncbi:hypothetical protein CHUAL_012484 [Chamberlinius hualienensis]
MGLFKKKLFGGSGVSHNNYTEPTLEKIVSDAAAENEFTLYKLVNYRRGGSILESYAATGETGGAKAIDKICQEQLADYMYYSGIGGTIKGSQCIAWRNRQRGEVYVAMSNKKRKSSKKESNDQLPCDVPTDHTGCWLLNQRGVLGENPLHVLVICDTPTHTKVAKILLRHYPKLASDIMECREYYGLSPLHLAVAYNNMELVQALVEAGANVNERATGRFFMPSDQKEKLKLKSNYSGFSYLGEYPLSWAACCENEAIYNYLLDRGADPNLQDTFGNMILHMVVISNKLGMYGYALRHPKKPANNELLNRAGLTPLTLACTLGRNNIFCEMLELSSQEFWRFSNITCSAYPLIALDSIGPDGRTNWKSALMIILNGESDEHLDMLEGGVVLRLLDDKWKTFARNQFLIRLGLLFLHLLVLSIAVYLRPKSGESLGWKYDPKTIIRLCAEIVTIISCGIFVFVQQGSEIRSQGLFQFSSNLVTSPAKFFFLISNIAILVCIPFRIFDMRLVEDSILTFALPGTWFFLMFFAGSVRLTGAFVTMIYSMIAGDMVRFGFIYVIALIGFSQAFFFLFKSCHVDLEDASETNIDMYETYYGTWMALFQMTLGSYTFGDFSKPKYSGLSMGIFVVFMVLVPILLLNVLIAMMSSTYSNVISKSEKEFVKQWAKIVLAVERSVPADKAKEHLNAYAINLAPPPGFDTESGMEFKGLMVIKSKSKTKAQQRKGALLNWRRMGKRLVGEMRKYSCKGNELIKRMKDESAKKAPRRGSLTQLLESVDQDYEANNAPPKGGLGEALSQLAFAHDIEITGVTTNAPMSPSDTSVSTGEKFDLNAKSKQQDTLEVKQAEVLIPITSSNETTTESIVAINTSLSDKSNPLAGKPLVYNHNINQPAVITNPTAQIVTQNNANLPVDNLSTKTPTTQLKSDANSVYEPAPNASGTLLNSKFNESESSDHCSQSDILAKSQLQLPLLTPLGAKPKLFVENVNKPKENTSKKGKFKSSKPEMQTESVQIDENVSLTPKTTDLKLPEPTFKTLIREPSFDIPSINDTQLESVIQDNSISLAIIKDTQTHENTGNKSSSMASETKPMNTLESGECSTTNVRPKTAPMNSELAETISIRGKKSKRRVIISTPSRKSRRSGFSGKLRRLASRVQPAPEYEEFAVSTLEKENEILDNEMASRPQTTSSISLTRGLHRWSTKPVISLECLMDRHDKEKDQEEL